jgi:hypothetical protein
VATPTAVCASIKERNITSVPLQPTDVAQLMDTLVADGRLDYEGAARRRAVVYGRSAAATYKPRYGGGKSASAAAAATVAGGSDRYDEDDDADDDDADDEEDEGSWPRRCRVVVVLRHCVRRCRRNRAHALTAIARSHQPLPRPPTHPPPQMTTTTRPAARARASWGGGTTPCTRG